MAYRGYCGIAQDVRLLYKTLSTCPDVEVTGLIYPPQKLVRRHKFRSPRAPRADRLANQAEFLWELGSKGLGWRDLRPWRSVEQLRTLAATFLAPARTLTGWTRRRFDTPFGGCCSARRLRPPICRSLPTAGSCCPISPMAWSCARAEQPAARAVEHPRIRLSDCAGPAPFRASRETRQIVRYHDMIPLLAPDTMGNPWVISWHHKAIRQSGNSFFVCNSEPTRDDLTSIYPHLARQSATIPYMLSDVYRPDPNSQMVCAVIGARRSAVTCDHAPQSPVQAPRYIMAVSTLEPRKNFIGLIRAFEMAKTLPSVRQRIDDLKLLIVGSPGWKYQPIVAMMRGLVQRGDLIHLEHVTAAELRALYSHAEAFVFPSQAEGFGFPPLEAIQCGTPAIVSDIPAHRWVMGDAALYCNPHDTASISGAIARLVASDETPGLRAELMARGRQRLELYSLARCRELWVDLLHGLKRPRANASGHADAFRPAGHAA